MFADVAVLSSQICLHLWVRWSFKREVYLTIIFCLLFSKIPNIPPLLQIKVAHIGKMKKLKNLSVLILECARLEDMTYKEQLSILGLFSLQKTEGLPHCCLQLTHDGEWKEVLISLSDGMWTNSLKLHQLKFRLGVRERVFTGGRSSTGTLSQRKWSWPQASQCLEVFGQCS